MQSWSIFQFNVGVSWYRICCLSFIIWQFCNHIHDLGSTNLWRRRALFSEHSMCAWVIFNNVTTEYDTSFWTFEVSVPTPCFSGTYVHQWGKVDFLQFPGWDRFEPFPFFAHCSFRIWNLYCFRHRNNQVVMVHRSISSACNMIFMMLGLRHFRSWPRGFMRFYCTTVSRLRNLWRCNQLTLPSPEAIAVHSFSGHGGCHRCFQFSPRILHCIPIFFFIWIHEIISSQLPSIFQFWLCNCSFLFFSIRSGFPNFGPYFRPNMIWSCGCLNFLSISARTTYNP